MNLIFNKKNISKINNTFGVYIFYDKDKKPIYIGKSINLKNRLYSYLGKQTSQRTQKMIDNISFFKIIKVRSEVEALLLEAKLVSKYKTFYNVQLKDDKSPLYIVITKDKYPIVKAVRKSDLKANYYQFGPFPNSKAVKRVLKMIRNIYPFSTHKLSKNTCIYFQLGLCKPCPSFIEKQKDKKLKAELKSIYLKNIKQIKKFLKGDLKKIKNDLKSDMKKYSNIYEFEKANEIKKQIENLNYITTSNIDPLKYIQNDRLTDSLLEKELLDLKNCLSKYFKFKKLSRIECFDASHISGYFPTASMVTFVDGIPEKKLYRRFSVKTDKKGDVNYLDEVVKRRIGHFKDWGVSDLIVVDGGKSQLSVFFKTLKKFNIPLIGIVKPNDDILAIINDNLSIANKENSFYKFEKIPSVELKSGINLVKRLRDEAHRFSKKYHRLLLKKDLLKI